MTTHKRVLVCSLIVVSLGLGLWGLWPAPPFKASVQLPEGVSLAQTLRSGRNEAPKGWHTNQYCLGALPAIKLGVREQVWLLLERIRSGANEMLGRTLSRAPGRPMVDYVTPRLGECYVTSGEKYLYAKELGWEVNVPPPKEDEFTFLGFVWGGTNRLRHARDRIVLIEKGIRENGIFGMRLNRLSPPRGRAPEIEYLPTNQCAIVRDTKGLVKILPLECLKAYVQAGLVTLPMRASPATGAEDQP